MYLAVPPVDKISIFMPAKAETKLDKPVLSDTETRARRAGAVMRRP
jgi:hypothetical protein